jgi:hypothetical protein
VIARREAIALGAAGLVAVVMPLLLLRPGPVQAPAAPAAKLQPLVPPAQPPLAAAFSRPLFAPAPNAPVADEVPGDAPELVGIVGRLDQDAVALVRTADGTSRMLRIGESVDGWKLESLALDAAFFTRGNERKRVPLPVG